MICFVPKNILTVAALTWKLKVWADSPSPPPLTLTEAWPLFSPPLLVVSHTILKRWRHHNCHSYKKMEKKKNKSFLQFVLGWADLPWGDFISAVDDTAGDPSHCDRVLDVFSSLAEVRAGNSHHGPSLYGTGYWVQLEHKRTKWMECISSLVLAWCIRYQDSVTCKWVSTGQWKDTVSRLCLI